MAIITIKEGTLVDCVWFVGWEGGDWLCMLYKHEGKPWEATYRFRYYHDQRSFMMSDDEKSGMRVLSERESDGPEQLRAAIDSVFAAFDAAACPHAVTVRDRIRVAGDGDAFLKAIANKPWANAREMENN